VEDAPDPSLTKPTLPKPARKLAWLPWLGVVLVALAGFGLWRAFRTPSSKPESRKSLPVALPESLVAEGQLIGPDKAWLRFQNLAGGLAAIAPSSVGGLLAVSLSLDVRLGEAIDGRAPIYFAVGAPRESGSSRPSFVVSMHLADDRKAKSQLIDGPDAPFSLRKQGDFLLVIPKKPLPIVAALSGDRLLLAGSEVDLANLAPYVLGALPEKAWGDQKIGAEDADLYVHLPQSGLRLAKKELAARWDDLKTHLAAEDRRLRLAHGGRAPDFGDPAAILALADDSVRTWLGRAEAVSDGALWAVFGKDTLTVDGRLSLENKHEPSSAWLSELGAGSPKELLSLPLDPYASAIVFQREAEDPESLAKSQAGSIAAVLGPRLSDVDRGSLVAFLSAAHAVRGGPLKLAARLSDHPFVSMCMLHAKAEPWVRVEKSFGVVAGGESLRALGMPLKLQVPAPAEPSNTSFWSRLDTPDVGKHDAHKPTMRRDQSTSVHPVLALGRSGELGCLALGSDVTPVMQAQFAPAASDRLAPLVAGFPDSLAGVLVFHPHHPLTKARGGSGSEARAAVGYWRAESTVRGRFLVPAAAVHEMFALTL
jgi:hypothetical protein